jgi:hypothetical protein
MKPASIPGTTSCPMTREVGQGHRRLLSATSRERAPCGRQPVLARCPTSRESSGSPPLGPGRSPLTLPAGQGSRPSPRRLHRHPYPGRPHGRRPPGSRRSRRRLAAGAGPPPGRDRARPQACRLAPRWLVASGPQVQVDPAALELKLIDLALTVILAAGLEREQFGISRKLLQLGQQFSHRHALRVARRAQLGMQAKRGPATTASELARR